MKQIIESELNVALLTLIEAGIGGRIIYTLIAAQADGESIPQALKKCKRLIFAGALALCIEGFVLLLQSYF